jgi:hypothetical protein
MYTSDEATYSCETGDIYARQVRWDARGGLVKLAQPIKAGVWNGYAGFLGHWFKLLSNDNG